VAYTVWIGLGTAGSVLFNMILFKEPKNLIRILSLLLIVIGVVGLKLFA
ncbi:SMR family transporter, partial [Bacillus safensis]